MPEIQRPRILVFVEYGWRNGGENSWLAAALNLMPSVEFVVACPPQTEFANSLSNVGIQQVAWNVMSESKLRKSQTEIRADMAHLIVELCPNVVHANSLSTGRLAGPVTSELRVPSVGYLRDIIKLSKQAIQDINHLTSIIAVSNATRNFHIGQGISEEKSHVLYNGVNLQQFRPSTPTQYLHQELELASGSRILLCVGQIGMRKGTDIVINSFHELSKTFDDLSLLLVGARNSGKDEAIEFEANCLRMSELTTSTNPIFWLGRRSDIAEIMNESTLLLHAARQEPLGRVLLESLSTGLPFVATDVGGTREIALGLDADAILCEPDSVESLTRLATKILKVEPLHESLSTQFRIQAERKFDIGICAERLRQVYTNLDMM